MNEFPLFERFRASRTLVPLLALLAISLACTNQTREDEHGGETARFTAEDALGRTVSIARPVERVVSLAPGVTEIVDAAGGFDRLAGVTTADDWPPGVDSLRKLQALPVDFEAITDIQADLVIATTEVNNPSDAATLESLGIPVWFVSNGSVEEIFAAILEVGRLLGSEETAAATVDSLEREIDALRVRTGSVSDRPSVIVLISPERSFSFGPESYVHDLIRIAGGRSLTENFPSERPILEDEFVLDAQPDVILGTFGPGFEPSILLDHHPTWIHTPAVRNGRVHTVSADELLRAGPRIVEAAREIASVLHPDLFSDEQEASGVSP